MVGGGRLGVFDDADRFENSITQVEDEKAKHERDRIAAPDKCIDDHNTGIKKQFDYDGQQERIDKFHESFMG